MKKLSKFTEILEINLSKSAITYLTYKFILLLKKPFKKWDAFKLGLINEKGEKIKDPETSEEKDALDGISNITRKVKRMLGKYIPNEKLLSFLVTVYLMKETINNKEYNSLSIRLQEYLSPDENETIIKILKEHKK